MRRRTALFAGAAALALVIVASSHRGSARPLASPVATKMALVATPRDPFARKSEIRVVVADGTATRTMALGTISHAPGAVIRGDVLRDTSGRTSESVVFVAADEEGAPDPDWGSVLFRVDPTGARSLARGLYHASRPLASVDGRVYVERGTSGPWPTHEEARAGKLRTDAITIDAIDPDTGAARTLYSWRGYTVHVAGELGSELVVYRVTHADAADAEGRVGAVADLVAIDRATGRSRIVASIPPFARDFWVDARHGAIMMDNRDDHDARLWAVESVDLTTGARTRSSTQRDEAPVPELLPNGEITWLRTRARGASMGTDAERIEALGSFSGLAGGIR